MTAGAIDPALVRRHLQALRPIAGFRNVLVHTYVAVDLAIVHSVLNQRLGDVRDFARHAEHYLEQ